nr:MAG TPA: hypothetical protein [Caudoviricetes sp.]
MQAFSSEINPCGKFELMGTSTLNKYRTTSSVGWTNLQQQWRLIVANSRKLEVQIDLLV